MPIGLAPGIMVLAIGVAFFMPSLAVLIPGFIVGLPIFVVAIVFTFGGCVAFATVGESLLTVDALIFHKPVQFFIQPIKPIQDPVNVCVDFRFGDILFRNFFSCAIE
jgi:hypothetical protein